ncbi:interleukin-1 receptor-like 2 isoform X2 [Genypterus blacodes]
MPTTICKASAGYLFVLKCGNAMRDANVTWSRAGEPLDTPGSELQVRDGFLLFLPLQTSHNGTYTCEQRDQRGTFGEEFKVLVSASQCPEPSEDITVVTAGGLRCKQKEIFTLNSSTHIRWLKDCSPVQRQGDISVSKDGFMRLLPPATERDAGKYTCLIDISLDGRKFTAARSIQLHNSSPVLVPPQVMYPKKQVVVVKRGLRAELKCRAFIGFSEEESSMFWTVGDTQSDDHPQLKVSVGFVHEEGKVYAESNLSISEVLPQFLNVPFHCCVQNPTEHDVGLLWLREADHSAFHTTVALCLAAFLVLLAMAAAFFFFKVELVLAYRKLLPHLAKEPVPDGKLYDAFVSFLHADTLNSAEVATFALQNLPAVLEDQHGYSLYIRERDECPGEAMHDAIAATVRRCRRLIIILSMQVNASTDGGIDEAAPLRDNLTRLCYEQKVGLHDALTQNDPRVILVEFGGPVDYSNLPESLRYIKRKQGALIWTNDSPAKHKVTQPCSNRVFWKTLRYHMPSVPARRRQTLSSV